MIRRHFWIRVEFTAGDATLIGVYASTERRARSSAEREAESLYHRPVRGSSVRSETRAQRRARLGRSHLTT